LKNHRKLILFTVAVLIIVSCRSIVKQDAAQEKGLVPLLTFVFDDGNDTDYLIAREVFKQHNATAGFAITTDWIGKKDYLTASQILELQKDGFEIMSHTVSHPDLKSLDEKQIEYELSSSKTALEGIGIRAGNLVYPYNKNNSLVREAAAKYYRSARGGRRMMNPAFPEKYELKSYSFSHNINKMKALIDRAYAEKKWLILYHHNLDIKVSVSPDNRGTFLAGEELLFSPSGARGRYIKELFSWLYFVPLSGTPKTGDTIIGQTSKATYRLDEIVYNDKEDIGELIRYTQSRYSDMKIVTIDQGLDIYNIK
jgi:peptidoglycan/xylan/chitin deacetylase (PgdA/CDA1 family)